MIVAVASGKGGTGKTTVAVGLAQSVAFSTDQYDRKSRVHLADCDVEEPNAHLFLRPQIAESREVGILTPEIDEARCQHCGRCAAACAFHALASLPNQVLLFPELCHGCGSCLRRCPTSAIAERLRVTGVVESGTAGDLAFSQGRLNVGEAMSVPILRELKRLVAARPADLVVLDAPPGTSCPVVETLRGADYALLVTEPTPFGLHDLRLAVEVARGELRLPVGVVVNRDGSGDGGVDAYCQNEGIPILLRIPLDRRIAAAGSDGHPLLAARPEYRDRFLALHERIRKEVGRCARS